MFAYKQTGSKQILRPALWRLQRFGTEGLSTLSPKPRIQIRRLPRAPTADLRERYAEYVRKREEGKEPIEARVLNTILKSSNTPYSSFVPSPKGILHGVHATVKQAWLVAILYVTGRTPNPLFIAGGVALLTVLSLQPRLWRAQLKRLGLLALFLYITTALFADGLPATPQPQHLPSQLEGIPALSTPNTSYRTVYFHFLFITITRRSLQLATSVSCLTFSALQSASLCLTTTSAEALAMGVKFWLSPLGIIGVNTAEISLILLLSLRFLAVVFEEIRNLALGVAARNLQWKAMGKGAGIQVSLRMLGRLFSNLLQHSQNIAIAMKSRGFTGPEQHRIVLASPNNVQVVPNALAVLGLAGLIATTFSLT